MNFASRASLISYLAWEFVEFPTTSFCPALNCCCVDTCCNVFLLLRHKWLNVVMFRQEQWPIDSCMFASQGTTILGYPPDIPPIETTWNIRGFWGLQKNTT